MNDETYVRRLEAVSENSIEGAAAIYKIRLEEIAKIISSSDTAAQAVAALSSNGININFLNNLYKHLFDAIATADALGRSHIVNKDASMSLESKRMPAKFSVGKQAATIATVDWFVCDDGIVKISYDLIPEDALNYIKYKSLVIAGVKDAELLAAIKDRILQSVKDGADFKQFKLGIDQVFDNLGVTRLDSRHLQTVFRTNLFSAYSIAQLDQISSMKDRFPLWRYVAILDSSTRPFHRELNDNIYRVGEGPIPPIDYNCRCTAQYLHIFEVQRQGLKPLDWTGDSRLNDDFDVQTSFEDWLKERQSLLSSETKQWIDDNK